MRLKREPGRRESAFWGPAEVSGGVILESKSVPNGFHSNKILGGFATSAGSECFRGSGSGWETERTRFRLVTRVCSSFIFHRSSIFDHRSSVIGHRSEE